MVGTCVRAFVARLRCGSMHVCSRGMAIDLAASDSIASGGRSFRALIASQLNAMRMELSGAHWHSPPAASRSPVIAHRFSDTASGSSERGRGWARDG